MRRVIDLVVCPDCGKTFHLHELIREAGHDLINPQGGLWKTAYYYCPCCLPANGARIALIYDDGDHGMRYIHGLRVESGVAACCSL